MYLTEKSSAVAATTKPSPRCKNNFHDHLNGYGIKGQRQLLLWGLRHDFQLSITNSLAWLQELQELVARSGDLAIYQDMADMTIAELYGLYPWLKNQAEGVENV